MSEDLEKRLTALKAEHDGLYWKVKSLERKLSNLESEVRRFRR